MPKGTSQAEAMSNSGKINPVALAVIELRLTEGISQSGSQLVTRKIFFFFKFYSNLLKAFQVDVKACLGLILPNQYCQAPWSYCEADFWSVFFVKRC